MTFLFSFGRGTIEQHDKTCHKRIRESMVVVFSADGVQKFKDALIATDVIEEIRNVIM